MIYRIYRVPGSKQWWHIDTGANTVVFNVKGYVTTVASKSVDRPDLHPRAWIEIEQTDTDFHIVNGVAEFTPAILPINNFIGQDKEGIDLFDPGCGKHPIYADGSEGEVFVSENPVENDNEHIE